MLISLTAAREGSVNRVFLSVTSRRYAGMEALGRNPFLREAVRNLCRGLMLGLLLAVTGCQDLRGPVWAPDGQLIAYTTYTHTQDGKVLETAVHLVDPGDDTGESVLLAKDAACPSWAPDGLSLYYLARRDQQGFYNAILRYTSGGAKLGEGQRFTVIEQPGLKLVGLQVTADGTGALLCSANDTRPGAPQQVEHLRLTDFKRQKIEVGEVYSPALTPDGRLLAYAQRPPADPKAPVFVAVLELDRKPLQPQAIFPTQTDNEPGAPYYVVQAFPDSDRVLFYAPGAKRIWVARRDGQRPNSYELPAGLSSPLMVALAEDGKTATLTMAGSAKGGRIHYHVYKLTFASRRFDRLDGDSPALLGGHALDPKCTRRNAPERWAWLSSGGLALGVPGNARYFPKTADQYLSTSRALIQQKQYAQALSAALKAREAGPPPEDPGAFDRAEASAYLASGDGTRASEAFEKSILLFPVGPHGLRFIFPANSGMPQGAGTDAKALVAEMEAYAEANPQDHLLVPLRNALLARVNGDYAKAMEHYREAEKVSPSEAFTGGVKFLEGMTAYEQGEMFEAGTRWESAARSNAFPQAEYAAGLAAIAYALDGRAHALSKADQALRLGVDMKGPLKTELDRLPQELRGLNYKQARASPLVHSPDKAFNTWVDITEYVVPQAYVRPTLVLCADRKYQQRRIAAQLLTKSTVMLAGLPEGTQAVVRVPRHISPPSFGPGNDLLAFTAQGEVFPLPDTFCEAYVVDFRGRILLGDARALQSGTLSTRSVINALTWTGARELHVKGSYLDVFGNETLLDKQETLTGK